MLLVSWIRQLPCGSGAPPQPVERIPICRQGSVLRGASRRDDRIGMLDPPQGQWAAGNSQLGAVAVPLEHPCACGRRCSSSSPGSSVRCCCTNHWQFVTVLAATQAVSPICVVRNSPGAPVNWNCGDAKYGSYPVSSPPVWLLILIRMHWLSSRQPIDVEQLALEAGILAMLDVLIGWNWFPGPVSSRFRRFRQRHAGCARCIPSAHAATGPFGRVERVDCADDPRSAGLPGVGRVSVAWRECKDPGGAVPSYRHSK